LSSNAAKATAADLARHADLSPTERETVHWLILRADRIGEHDIGPVGRA